MQDGDLNYNATNCAHNKNKACYADEVEIDFQNTFCITFKNK